MSDPQVRFDDRGLVPAIIQHAATGAVLTLAWMNAESLAKTLASGETWLWSRSRGELWHKGETSGNTQRVVGVTVDCDGDAILVRVVPAGPACHTGAPSCFATPIGESVQDDPGDGLRTNACDLGFLDAIVAARHGADPATSYTASLLAAGVDRIARKVVEEAGETVIAAKNPGLAELVAESADLVYHLAVLLSARGSSLAEVVEALRRRHDAGGAV